MISHETLQQQQQQQQHGSVFYSNKSLTSHHRVLWLGIILLFCILQQLVWHRRLLLQPPRTDETQDDEPPPPPSNSSNLQLPLSSSQNDDASINDIEMMGPFRIHTNWHPKTRTERRFPSVTDRVKLYMGNWYHPPCPDASVGRFANHYDIVISSSSSSLSFSSNHDDVDTNNNTSLSSQNNSWAKLTVRNPWIGDANKNNDASSAMTMTLDSVILPDRRMLLQREVLLDCARNETQYKVQGKLPNTESRIKRRWSMQSFCSEVVILLELLEELDDRENHNDKENVLAADASQPPPTPLLASFGDNETLCYEETDCLFEVPLILKHRARTCPEYLDRVTADDVACWSDATPRPPLETTTHVDLYRHKFSPILWRLETVRHWNTLPGALRKDVPWEHKANRAFFGGDMTGKWHGETDHERCRSNQRCAFVMDHHNSTRIDARITYTHGVLKNSTVDGIKVTKEKVGVEIVQQYKAILCFEGNDVASGLKWMLQSESVVIMPHPTRTSWAMEELLEPWVHYIPIRDDGSDAEERVQWVFDNDLRAKRIAERATLFVYDLAYHPDAAADDLAVKREIARRYRDLWQ